MEKKITKKAKVQIENKELNIDLELKGEVDFVFENAPYHKNGEIERISASMALLFLKKGYGQIHNK